MKLHLGCGNKKLSGYKSVDIRPEVKPDVVADVRDLHMFDNNSVDEVYFCHGLEHIPEDEVHEALEEWQRILKPGSWLYLAVPDFEMLVGMYCNGEWTLAPPITSALMGGQDYDHNFHYSLWDEHKLRMALESAGFHHISRYHAHKYLPDGFMDWSARKVGGLCLSLNMRALA
jgi:predicted SAM-dependent methyltransferase